MNRRDLLRLAAAGALAPHAARGKEARLIIAANHPGLGSPANLTGPSHESARPPSPVPAMCAALVVLSP
jgi:hypothetical protein